jgi:hypothetical protein
MLATMLALKRAALGRSAPGNRMEAHALCPESI